MNPMILGALKTPLIGGGGVAEMGRMVEFHTDLTAGFERESGGPSTLRFGSHKLTDHDASSCVTGKNQRRKECHEDKERSKECGVPTLSAIWHENPSPGSLKIWSKASQNALFRQSNLQHGRGFQRGERGRGAGQEEELTLGEAAAAGAFQSPPDH